MHARVIILITAIILAQKRMLPLVLAFGVSSGSPISHHDPQLPLAFLIARPTETPPQGEARRGHEEGKREHEVPFGALPQKGERKPEALPRMCECELERARMKTARLAGGRNAIRGHRVHLGGVASWGPGGGTTGERILNAKRKKTC
jgi:hypothetical protein